MPGLRTTLLALLVIMVASGCQSAAYAPGLGEIMSVQQMRHAKLWYAGQAGNWALADYEIDELGEGFADVVRYHPTHKDAPQPLAELVPSLVDGPLHAVRDAVAARDAARFARAFDELTVACNSCHEATRFGFNRVTRPAAGAYPNQEFGIAR